MGLYFVQVERLPAGFGGIDCSSLRFKKETHPEKDGPLLRTGGETRTLKPCGTSS